MVKPISLDSLLQGLDVPGMEGVEKAASVANTAPELSGAAKELEEHLTKQANEVSPDMSTQKGRNIAAGVMALVKRALDEASMAPAGPNNVIAETAAQAASSTAGQQAIPKDGNITQTMQAILQNGLASGAVGPDQLYLNSIAQGQDEGNSPVGLMSSDGRDINAVAPGASMSEQVEKVAALVHLVDNGVDFDNAVTLIKQAEEEIIADQWEQEKVATVNELMDYGYDMETAVDMVKQAVSMQSAGYSARKAYRGAKEAISGAYESARSSAGKLQHSLGLDVGNRLSNARAANAQLGRTGDTLVDDFGNQINFITGKEGRVAIPEDMESLKLLRQAPGQVIGTNARKALNYGKAVAPTALAVGGVGAAGYGGYKAMSHDKKASAIEGLVLAGYSVEQALQLLEG